MACYLCGGEIFEPVPGRVRDRPEIPILRCTACGLVFLGSFSHVHDAFYETDYTDENHATQDWRSYLNECRQDDERRFGQLRPLIGNRSFLDVGCGAGGVLLMAREHCKQATGVEPQARWRPLLSKAGVDMAASLAAVADASQDVISLFHVLEHISDPLPFLRELLAKSAPGGRVVIEVPNADDALLSLYQSKAFSEFTYWSPHLFLYNPATLARLLEKAGITRDRFTVSQYQRYPLANHLMWLAEGRPGGHAAWSFLDSPALTEAYAAQLAAQGRCDTLIAWINT
ncbi:MAG: class I SAM-dependent methyltransferase [Gallionellaceae bacterium]|nr:class I SAM-dependent methyltransferase [Gallionellaceae bacterium]